MMCFGSGFSLGSCNDIHRGEERSWHLMMTSMRSQFLTSLMAQVKKDYVAGFKRSSLYAMDWAGEQRRSAV